MYDTLGASLPIYEAEYRISPWGPERDDWRAFRLAVALIKRECRWSDFDYLAARRGQSVNEAKAHMTSAANLWPGAKITHGSKP